MKFVLSFVALVALSACQEPSGKKSECAECAVSTQFLSSGELSPTQVSVQLLVFDTAEEEIAAVIDEYFGTFSKYGSEMSDMQVSFLKAEMAGTIASVIAGRNGLSKED